MGATFGRASQGGGVFTAAFPCGFIFLQKDMKNNSQGRPRQLGEFFLISFPVHFGGFSKARKIAREDFFITFTSLPISSLYEVPPAQVLEISVALFGIFPESD